MLFYVIVIGIPSVIGFTKLIHKLRKIQFRLDQRDNSLNRFAHYVEQEENKARQTRNTGN